MGARDERVDAYIRKSAPFARPILEHLREAVHAAVPDVTERIKWGMPSLELNGFFCHLAAFKAHVSFGFWATEPLADLLAEAGVGKSDAMGHFGRITALSDLPSKRALAKLIRGAAAIRRQTPGRIVKAESRPVPRMPADFTAALQRNAAARRVYAGFPPGKRRDYLEWILEAKTPATRARRIATAVEWLAEGKSRNWKYERR